ncbi:MAG TPA: ribosome maturation factor RimM [Polyangia bacterium]
MPATPADNPRDSLALGVLGRPHGVRGELVFHPHNPGGIRLEDLRYPVSATIGSHVRGADSKAAVAFQTVKLLGARPFGDKSLVRIEGLSSPEAAAALTNRELLLPRDSLPPLEPGEYYVADLIGCAAFDPSGVALGTVTSVFWNGRHDVLTITPADATPKSEERLIPAVPDFLVEVDLEARRLVIDDHE